MAGSLRRAALGIAIGLGTAAVAVAQPSPVATSPAGLAAEASDALKRMSATMAAAASFTVRITSTREERLPSGQSVLLGATGVVAVRRPDRIATAFGSDLGSFAVWYDGRTLAVLNLTENVYASAPFDGSLTAAVDWLEDRLGISIPVRPIVAADPFAAVTEAGPTSGVSLGRTYLGDVAVDHLALRNPAFDWEIWLEATPQALPRRVSLRRRGDGDGARVILDFAAWNLGAELPDSAFAFTAPPGATETTMVLRPQ